jgi:FKBP-type peptidyl-prolyl cis-trans isomerase (trigger factor)
MPKEEKKDFKATKCKVTVLSIATADLPEVDEEFSKAMGTQSVADLRTQVMLRLKGNAESVADGKQREDIDDQLVKLIDFEIPKSLIDAEIKTKTQLKEQELKQANFSDEDIKKKEKETEKEAHEAAIRSLKLFFIFQKLANDHNIIVPEKELLEVVSERVSQLNLPAEFKSSPQFNNHIIQEIRMNCFVELLSDKVKRYLLKKVIPT